MKILINSEVLENDYVDCDIIVILPNKCHAKMSAIFKRSLSVALRAGTANHVRLQTRDDVIISRRLMANDTFISAMSLPFLTMMADVTHVAAMKVMNFIYLYIDTLMTRILDETFKKEDIPRLNTVLDHFDQKIMGDDDVDVSRRMARLYDSLVDGRVRWCILTHLHREDSHYIYMAVVDKVNPITVLPDDEDSGDEMIM